MRPLTQTKFLQKLAQEAELQAQLEQKKLLPQKLSAVGRMIVAYPWQIGLILSGISAFLILFFIKT